MQGDCVVSPIVDLCCTGRFAEAERMCTDLMARNVDSIAIEHLMAIIYYQTGRLSDALRCLRDLVASNPADAELKITLGLIAEDQSQYQRAIHSYRAALCIDPNHFYANWHLANLHLRLNDYEQAKRCFCRALHVRPDDISVLLNLGITLLRAGHLSEAEKLLERAVRLAPGHIGVLSNYGRVLVELNRFEDAQAVLQSALQIEPENTRLLNHLGYLYELREQWGSAEELFRKACRLRPDCDIAQNNIGRVLRETGRFEKSEAFLRAALRHSPGNDNIRMNLSYSLLQQAKYREGMELYEIRPLEARNLRRIKALPMWQGRPLSGERIMVAAEGGIGDMLQYSRYLIPLAKMDCDVTFEVPDRAVELFSGQFENVRIAGAGEDRQGFDIQTRLMSLPLLLKLWDPFWPEGKRYLRSPQRRMMEWAKRLSDTGSAIRLAICWRGSKTSDISRDIPIAFFKPLSLLKHAKLFSVQMGEAAGELDDIAWSDSVADLSGHIDKDYIFADTSAIFANMDVVVTCDTGPAHLAGALGVHTCLALKAVPEWRWGISDKRTSWYPSMRLFRGTSGGGWDPVLQAITRYIRCSVPWGDGLDRH